MSSLPPPIPQRPSPVPQPIAYGVASAQTHASSFSWGMFLWSGGILFIFMAIVRFVVPRLMEVFMDFKVELPAPTKALFAVARIARNPIWLILILTIPIAIGFATGPLSPGARRAVRLAMTLVLGLLIAFLVVALFVPLVTLMQGMTSSGKV